MKLHLSPHSLILALCLLIPVFFTLAGSVRALTTPQDRIDNAEENIKLNVDQMIISEQTQSILTGLRCAAFDCITSPASPNPGTRITAGAFQSITKQVAQLVTDPPIKSSEYIADVLHNSGFVQPAYAQGLGFSSLSPILRVWKPFRDLAYFFFIIIFVVVGFMIMFRAQINPQTIVTVQAALPKMVLTLLLITFSYAIAGFVVDLIYLLLFMVISLFDTMNLLSNAGTVRDTMFGSSILKIAFDFLIAPGNTVAGQSAGAVGDLLANVPGVPDWFDGIASALAYLIIAVALLIAMFRTFFSLVMAWIGIVVSVIFAPFQLLLNAIPGVDTFGGWLKGLIANALVFPAVGLMLLLGVILIGNNAGTAMGVATTNTTSPEGWMPPFITNSGYGGPNQAQAIIGLGIIMLLPETVKFIKGALGIKDNELFGAVTQNLQAGWGGVKAGAGFGRNRFVQYQQLKALEADSEEEARLHGMTTVRTPYSSTPVDPLAPSYHADLRRRRALRYFQQMFGL
jgi:hypothetical protein